MNLQQPQAATIQETADKVTEDDRGRRFLALGASRDVVLAYLSFLIDLDQAPSGLAFEWTAPIRSSVDTRCVIIARYPLVEEYWFEIRARGPNELLEEKDGCFEVAIYLEALETLEVVCFSYGLVGGLHTWLMKTDRKDSRFQALLAKVGLEPDFFDCLPAITEPDSDAAHKAIWSVITPLIAAV